MHCWEILDYFVEDQSQDFQEISECFWFEPFSYKYFDVAQARCSQHSLEAFDTQELQFFGELVVLLLNEINDLSDL